MEKRRRGDFRSYLKGSVGPRGASSHLLAMLAEHAALRVGCPPDPPARCVLRLLRNLGSASLTLGPTRGKRSPLGETPLYLLLNM